MASARAVSAVLACSCSARSGCAPPVGGDLFQLGPDPLGPLIGGLAGLLAGLQFGDRLIPRPGGLLELLAQVRGLSYRSIPLGVGGGHRFVGLEPEWQRAAHTPAPRRSTRSRWPRCWSSSPPLGRCRASL